jgi:hypothetical protein
VRALAVPAAFAALLLALVPVLRTPHVSDDVVNYSFGWLQGAEFFRVTNEEVRDWILSAGRAFVFSSYLKNAVFKAFHDLLSYKVFLVAMNMAAAIAFFGYVRMLTRSVAVPALALLCLPVLIQLRDYHDPVVSFNALFQLGAALIFGSLAAHLAYLRTGRARWLVVALFLFAVNLLLYEMAAVTAALVLVQERFEPAGERRRYRATAWFLALVAIYGVQVVVSRWIGAHYFGMAVSPYEASFSLGGAAMGLLKQLFAVVPFSYFLMRPHDGAWTVYASPDATPWLAFPHFYAAVAIFFVLAWLALRAVGSGAHGERREPLPLWIGAGLVVLPAVVIACIARYQNTLGWGDGHLPVYYQVFGAALALGCGIETLLKRFPASAMPLVAVLAIGSAGNLVDNLAVAAKLREAWGSQYPWRALLWAQPFRDACGWLPLVIADPRPWTEIRVIRNAGLHGIDWNEPIPASGAYCVAGTVTTADRPVVAWLRVDGAPQPRASLLVRVDGRVMPRLAGCSEGERRAPEDEFAFAGDAYAMFDMGSAVVWTRERREMRLDCASSPSILEPGRDGR